MRVASVLKISGRAADLELTLYVFRGWLVWVSRFDTHDAAPQHPFTDSGFIHMELPGPFAASVG